MRAHDRLERAAERRDVALANGDLQVGVEDAAAVKDLKKQVLE